MKRFERHWATERIADVFSAMAVDEWISKKDVAIRCDISVERVSKSARSAYLIAQREDHVLVRPELRDGVRGFRRLSQEDASLVVKRHISKMRGAARRGSAVFKEGVTDFSKIERNKRSEMFAEQAQLSTVLAVTSPSASRKLLAEVETANDRIDVGRTLKILGK